MKSISWINCLLGIWLIISPFALGYSSVPSVLYAQVILGLLIAVFGFYNAAGMPEGAGTKSPGLSWIVAVLGILTALVPFATRYALPSKATANDVVVGVVILILALYNALKTPYRFPVHRAQH